MFRTLLIANRGEIACRVIRTARRMGIRTVAVYSDADAQALHVEMADEAYHVGASPAAESYLVVERILEAARAAGAEAIHPGYGFLSENESFAEACDKAGIVFVGPPAAAIRAMGSKSNAKQLMEKAGVPLVPGYHGDEQDEEKLAAEAKRIGYPVLIKASAGGGGKGMRVVEAEEKFSESLASARREAKAAFGDEHVLVEKYLVRPRHIEVQVFCDGHGNGVWLFERDCSIQRRHQKIVEEAPAPGMEEGRRREMGEAAVAAARAIDYRGAGTVEFIVDEDGSFYFMEMNTRLQVEHPVTEMITGEDLVEWQLRVAAGEELPRAQDELAISGHSVEVRLYAEDPDRNFMPSIGTLEHLRFPEGSERLRIETGVRGGDEVSMFYDPMIAKLVTWGPDRAAAVHGMVSALGATEVVGVTTNLRFLRDVLDHPAFVKAELDTRFIERHEGDLFPERGPADPQMVALAVLAELKREQAAQAREAATSGDPHSPWAALQGWRLNGPSHEVVHLRDGETVLAVNARHVEGGGFALAWDGAEIDAHGELLDGGALVATIDGVRLNATAIWHGEDLVVMTHARSHRFASADPRLAKFDADAVGGAMTAPMPGKVISVMVEAGKSVRKGAALMVLEAMKMEHTIAAPANGTVAAINYGEGDLVEEGAELLEFEAERD